MVPIWPVRLIRRQPFLVSSNRERRDASQSRNRGFIIGGPGLNELSGRTWPFLRTRRKCALCIGGHSRNSDRITLYPRLPHTNCRHHRSVKISVPVFEGSANVTESKNTVPASIVVIVMFKSEPSDERMRFPQTESKRVPARCCPVHCRKNHRQMAPRATRISLVSSERSSKIRTPGCSRFARRLARQPHQLKVWLAAILELLEGGSMKYEVYEDLSDPRTWHVDGLDDMYRAPVAKIIFSTNSTTLGAR
jgi:hypothetical protein